MLLVELKALVNVSNEYESFTESNMSGETKFILKIDSAKKEVKSVSDTSSKTKTTFSKDWRIYSNKVPLCVKLTYCTKYGVILTR